jgi:uncharacterized protein (DUF885 family)
VTELEIYRLMRRQFRAIDENVDELARNCTNFAQAKQLSDEWTQAQKNYVEARNKVFNTSSAKVKALYEQLGEAQEDVEKNLENLKRVDRVLDKIGDAVRLATTLVALGK